MKGHKHNCWVPDAAKMWSDIDQWAFTSCSEDEESGELYCINDYMSTQVNYCPICGYKAKVQIKEIKNG